MFWRNMYVCIYEVIRKYVEVRKKDIFTCTVMVKY